MNRVWRQKPTKDRVGEGSNLVSQIIYSSREERRERETFTFQTSNPRQGDTELSDWP
jgi:hypothetical protein